MGPRPVAARVLSAEAGGAIELPRLSRRANSETATASAGRDARVRHKQKLPRALAAQPPRVCGRGVAETPIDALSFTAIENVRADTLCAATGGEHGTGNDRRLDLLRAYRNMPNIRPFLSMIVSRVGRLWAARQGSYMRRQHALHRRSRKADT
jgi:hypothetical protein